MSSDDHNRSGRDPVWRNIGTGMPATYYCPRCNTIGPFEGQRKWRLKMNQCAKCVAASEAKKVAA